MASKPLAVTCLRRTEAGAVPPVGVTMTTGGAWKGRLKLMACQLPVSTRRRLSKVAVPLASTVVVVVVVVGCKAKEKAPEQAMRLTCSAICTRSLSQKVSSSM